MMELNRTTEAIFGAGIEVHRHLGPGLLESTYEHCLCHGLKLRNLPFQRQLQLPACYKGTTLDCACRIDLLVAEQVVVELKSMDKIEMIHEAQLLSYPRLGGWKIGLLINFNVSVLKDGIKRRIL